LHVDFLLALLDLSKNLGRIQLQEIAEKIGFVRLLEPMRFQALAGSCVYQQQTSAAVSDD